MSANELQKAVFLALASDATVTALCGPEKVFDGRPLRKDLPYLHFGNWRVVDNSTATEPGTEHRFEIEVWSEKNGHLEAAAIADAVVAALHDQPLAMSGQTLVNLRHERTNTGRVNRSRLYRARVEFRAVLEPTA